MRIPRTLDNPGRMMGVPMDLAFVFIGSYLTLSQLFNLTIMGWVVGFIITLIFGRFRSPTLTLRMKAWIYWHFPSQVTGITPAGNLRELVHIDKNSEELE